MTLGDTKAVCCFRVLEMMAFAVHWCFWQVDWKSLDPNSSPCCYETWYHDVMIDITAEQQSPKRDDYHILN